MQSLITCNMQLDGGGTLAFVRKNRVEASCVCGGCEAAGYQYEVILMVGSQGVLSLPPGKF